MCRLKNKKGLMVGVAGGTGLWGMNFFKSIVICVSGKKVNIYILYKQFYFAFSSYS